MTDATTDTNNDRDVARDVFWRLHEVYQRGHVEWMQHVRRLEDMYLGGGRMWKQADRLVLEAEGRACREVNTILPTVNAAAGFQIANRFDIAYLPQGNGASEQTAKLLSKVVKFALDNTDYRYGETDSFLDGMIQQRGYLDLRMGYDQNINGDVVITTPDPMDVIPDPDAKGYDPDSWADVLLTRWLTAREIEGIYGKAAADAVVASSTVYVDSTAFGTDYVRRTGFSEMPASYAQGFGWYQSENLNYRRYRIVDKQSNEYAQTLCGIWPGGDVRSVAGFERDRLAWLIDQGVAIMPRRIRRVRWQVAAPEVSIFNQISPYDHVTIIPFFPYFRRGRTIGMVDNMVSPSEMLNKFVSQFEHVTNSSANSGWQGEEKSLANMTDDEFTSKGAQTGLVLLRKAGAKEFTKIQPNQVPTGLDKMIEFSHNHLNIVSGVDPNGMQIDTKDMSGVALQSLEYAQQRKLAIALDNQSRSRRMVAGRTLEMCQRFMGDERVLHITEVDQYGVERRVPIAINVMQENGEVLNDLTVGQYTMAINERPANVTFNNSEFEQMKAMRKDMNIPIPDAVVVRASNLADKSEIAQILQEQQGKTDPTAEADVALKQALARKATNEAVSAAITSQYSALQTATAIVVTPQAAALADALLRSGGFVDQDAPPIIPELPAGQQQAALPSPQLPENTHPLDPAHPDVGLDAGLSDGPNQPPPAPRRGLP